MPSELDRQHTLIRLVRDELDSPTKPVEARFSWNMPAGTREALEDSSGRAHNLLSNVAFAHLRDPETVFVFDGGDLAGILDKIMEDPALRRVEGFEPGNQFDYVTRYMQQKFAASQDRSPEVYGGRELHVGFVPSLKDVPAIKEAIGKFTDGGILVACLGGPSQQAPSSEALVAKAQVSSTSTTTSAAKPGTSKAAPDRPKPSRRARQSKGSRAASGPAR